MSVSARLSDPKSQSALISLHIRLHNITQYSLQKYIRYFYSTFKNIGQISCEIGAISCEIGAISSERGAISCEMGAISSERGAI